MDCSFIDAPAVGCSLRTWFLPRLVSSDLRLFDGDHWFIEYDNQNTIVSSNLYGNGIDEILYRFNSEAPAGSQRQWLYPDRNNNTSMVTGEEGEVLEWYRYDAFGLPSVYNASNTLLPGGTAIANRFLFTGREWNPAQKFYEYRNRAYSPSLGRFTSEDPKGFDAGDYNLYRYVGNDPLDKTDPMGLAGPEPLGEILYREAVKKQLKELRSRVAAIDEGLKKVEANSNTNVIKDAQSADHRTPARTANGLKPNNTDPNPYSIGAIAKALLGLFTGARQSTSRGATIYYDPNNQQAGVHGRVRPPIFGLANELGEMFSANTGTWGDGGPTRHDNRSIWYENQAREAFGADPRPYLSPSDSIYR